MKVKVKIYPQKIKAITEAQKIAVRKTAEQMRDEVIAEQVIPFDTGNLQNVSTNVDTNAADRGVISIVHDTKYAARLYYHPEYNFQNTFNRNARGLWWDNWINGAKRLRPRELFKLFLRKNSKGVIK